MIELEVTFIRRSKIMLVFIDKSRNKLISFILKYRLGKRPTSARIIFYLLSLFDNSSPYINTKELGKRHHFVPRFLLKQFKIGGSEIWRYSKATKVIEKIPIKNACQIKNFYIIKDSKGEQSDYLEKKLFAGTLENFGSRVIYRLYECKNNFELSHPEESTVAVFLANQITRVPYFHNQVRKLLLYLFEKKGLTKEKLEDIEYIKDFIVKNKIGVVLEDFVKYVPTINFDGGSNHIQIISNLFANYMAEQIYKSKTLHLLDAPSDWEFAISDNPVIIVNLDTGNYLKIGSWLSIANPNILIFLPISKTRSIFYSPKQRKESRIDNNNDMVQLVNHAQFDCSNEFTHSHSRDLLEKYIKYFSV